MSLFPPKILAGRSHDLFLVLFTPLDHFEDDAAEGVAVVGRFIFDFFGVVGVLEAADDAVEFHFAEFAGEHAGCDAGDASPDLAEAAVAVA